MTFETEMATRLGVAALAGAAIGLERQWSGHATGAQARFGGVRTFTLLGITAGAAAELWNAGFGGPATVVLAGAAALVVAAYVMASQRDVDATTEVAAMVVLAAGALAGGGYLAMASAVIAVTVLLLVEKSRLHSFVRRLDDVEIRAGARFAVMAAVVLPLLPEGPYGPLGGVRPREIWALVLILSGLSFAGYVARRIVGPEQGYAVAGLLGGLVSSTSVTLAFSRVSQTAKTQAMPLAIGVVGASSLMFARLAVVTAALNWPLGLEVARLLAAPLLGGAVLTALGLLRREKTRGRATEEPRNPLQIAAALQMAIVFQVVLLAVHWIRQTWGGTGMIASGAIVGLTDTDALALSMARSTDADSVAAGALAIAVGGLSNTLAKLALAVTIGRGRYRLLAGAGLGVLATLSGIAIALVWSTS